MVSESFLEVVGEPESGKTTLIEFLWKLLGRESYEGFDPAKATMAAMSRNLAQVANLPAVFIEGDRGADALRSRSFDFDETKPLSDGPSIRARGVRNAGNETYEPPFRSALVITQNVSVLASAAVMEAFTARRMVHEHEMLISGAVKNIRVIAKR